MTFIRAYTQHTKHEPAHLGARSTAAPRTNKSSERSHSILCVGGISIRKAPQMSHRLSFLEAPLLHRAHCAAPVQSSGMPEDPRWRLVAASSKKCSRLSRGIPTFSASITKVVESRWAIAPAHSLTIAAVRAPCSPLFIESSSSLNRTTAIGPYSTVRAGGFDR